MIWKLDRLGQSVLQLVDLVGDLRKEEVQFKSLTDAIDTGTAFGRFFSRLWQVWLRWKGTDRRAHTCRARDCASARQNGWPEAANDRWENQSCRKTAGQRCSSPRCGQQPRGVRSHPL